MSNIRLSYKPNRKMRSKHVPDMVERAGKKQGAYIRKVMMSSIRRRKTPSPAGRPPRNKTNTLKRFILFAWDSQTQSVVIGPKKLPRKIAGQPNTLEFGGQGEVYSDYPETRVVRIRARPFAKPALEKSLSKMPELFKDTLR